MEKYLEQSYELFKEIAGKYPDAKIGKWNEDPRNFYYSWLSDRQAHGIKEGVYEFSGVKLEEWIPKEINFIKLAKERHAIDQYLTSAWPGWDKVRFIVGYIRYGETDTYGHDKVITEVEGELYVIPGVLRMAGIPVDATVINPYPPGAGSSEWAVGLPSDVAAGLIKKYPDVVLGPGYTFGLYNVGGGLAKDGVREIWLNFGPVGSKAKVYLWRMESG